MQWQALLPFVIMMITLVTRRIQMRRRNKFPEHWGDVPAIQTKDMVPFPEPYQHMRGSSTVKNWILENQENDSQSPWENLVGFKASYAKSVILKAWPADKPDLTIVILPEGSPVTMDYRQDRVRIFHDKKMLVVVTPSIG